MKMSVLLFKVWIKSYRTELECRKAMPSTDRIDVEVAAKRFGWFPMNKSAVHAPALCRICRETKAARSILHNQMDVMEFGETHPTLRRRITQMLLLVGQEELL